MTAVLFKIVIAILTATTAITAKPIDVKREPTARQDGAYFRNGDFDQPLDGTWTVIGAERVQLADGNYVLEVPPLKKCPNPGTLKGYRYGAIYGLTAGKPYVLNFDYMFDKASTANFDRIFYASDTKNTPISPRKVKYQTAVQPNAWYTYSAIMEYKPKFGATQGGTVYVDNDPCLPSSPTVTLDNFPVSLFGA